MKKPKKVRIALKHYYKKRQRGLEFIRSYEKKPDKRLFSESPTPFLFLLHLSNGDEHDYHTVLPFLSQFGTISNLVVVPGINYGYIAFTDTESAAQAHETFNQVTTKLPFQPKPHPIALQYTPLHFHELKLIEGATCDLQIPVNGLTKINEYISQEYEELIVEELDKNKWEALTNRRVQHYGFDFVYGANNVNPDEPSKPMPEWIQPLLDQLYEKYNLQFDQLTVNEYLPGNSIPPHIDSHSPFEETIAAVSLLSPIAMLFRKDNEDHNLFIEPRSLVVMQDEARYTWKHAITQRKYDILNGNVVFRNRRISLTFRKLRNKPCECRFPEYCDRNTLNKTLENSDVKKPTNIEKEFVYETYDKIAPHFSNTRYKPWPKVEEFLRSQPPHCLVLDIGCGNGKYLAGDPLCRIGTDRSKNLLGICSEREFSTFTADCLDLPVREHTFDVCISIAVIHHLSTDSLRLQAVTELLRVLAPGGSALIYVWAKEQTERSFTEQDCFVPWHLNVKYEDGEVSGEVAQEKQAVVYKRFYHVFVKGELEKLVFSANSGNYKFQILQSYFDRSNWCVIAKKVSK